MDHHKQNMKRTTKKNEKNKIETMGLKGKWGDILNVLYCWLYCLVFQA